MYEVAFQGGGQYHDEYCSTGSGHPFAFLAMASVKHYNVNSLNLTQAKALAYRVIDTICSTAGFGVSGPVQMGVVTSEGATILDTPELEAIKDSVNLWKGQEKEAIGALAGTDADSAPAAGQEIDHLVEGLDPPEAS